MVEYYSTSSNLFGAFMSHLISQALYGRYSVTKKNTEGQTERQYNFNNLIIPNGLKLINQQPMLNKLTIGSGTIPPAFNDTGPAVRLAGEWVVTYESTEASRDELGRPTIEFHYTGVIPEGVSINGISEFCISSQDDKLFSRALLKDDDGELLTIDKLESEYLEIKYTVAFKMLATEALVGQIQQIDETNISVYAQGFANATNLQGIDSGNFIKSASVREDAALSVSDTTIPLDLTPVTIVPSPDYFQYVTLARPASASSYQIHSVVLQSNIGWYQYRFSPAINVPVNVKWSMRFGVQWNNVDIDYSNVPVKLKQTNVDTVVVTNEFIVTAFDSKLSAPVNITCDDATDVTPIVEMTGTWDIVIDDILVQSNLDEQGIKDYFDALSDFEVTTYTPQD